jgi:pimeloyl-ACP methyl ester carboxylesterase
MTWQATQRTEINGVKLEILDRGSGEPVVFVHGGMGDECAAVLAESALANQFRLIHYHRRGFGNSEAPKAPVSISQQAADCRAVMRHLGVERAHCVGQSYGAVILLQTALDFSDAVYSLALLEPPLPFVLYKSPEFSEMAETAIAMYRSGDKAAAIETFGREVCGDDYRAVCDRTMPPGYFEHWVAEADTLFHNDFPELGPWQFTREDAVRITQPVLNVVGANTRRYFREVHETLQKWLPHAENVELPDATHCMNQTNPKGAAECLASFFSRHRLQGHDRPGR